VFIRVIRVSSPKEKNEKFRKLIKALNGDEGQTAETETEA